MPVSIVRDDSFIRHDPGPEHPECPARLAAIDRALQQSPLELVELPPRSATPAEVGRVHTGRYVERLLSLEGRVHEFDGDTRTSEGSVQAALRAAGAAIDIATQVANKASPPGMALVRPPGHHATPSGAMGFCLINNVAAAAAALRSAGAERVAIYDFDVHHGNGTETIFEHDPSVLFMSTHQWPFYPGSGAAEDRGKGDAEGATINVPLPPGVSDELILEVTDKVLAPATRAFAPDAILISAGFDGYVDDPIGGFSITAEGFGALATRWGDLASELCDGRIAAVLEGGYDLNGLGACVRAVLQAWD